MNHCTGAPAELWLERYIQGALPDAEAQQFEEHYFDCPVCLAQLEALQAVRARLERIPAKQARASQPAPKRRATVISWPKAAAALVALAASLAIVYLGERFALPNLVPPGVSVQIGPPPAATPHSQPSQQPASVAQLADLTLPPFRAATLRGEGEDAVFVSGMKAYSASNCRAAIFELGRVPASSSNARSAQFYSGVCQMHLGNLSVAAAALQRVASAGDSPQQEAAFYYLAQVALARNDKLAARQAIERTLALHGDFEQRARLQSAALAAAAGK